MVPFTFFFVLGLRVPKKYASPKRVPLIMILQDGYWATKAAKRARTQSRPLVPFFFVFFFFFFFGGGGGGAGSGSRRSPFQTSKQRVPLLFLGVWRRQNQCGSPRILRF